MTMVPCPACRFENPSDFSFCGKCGQNLSTPPLPTQILVVDDEPRITELLTQLFELEGITIRAASSVHEAIPMIHKEKPSVIITDMMMPEVNGCQFIRMLKENPETRTIKIIVLTVVDAFEDVRKSVLLGADDYICKPFDPAELLWSVQRLLGRFRPIKAQKEKAFG